eukprot:11443713-Heterocapsa_arctica.AAC.1
MGIPYELVELIADMYREPTFAVKKGKARSSERKQTAGIRQGCPLSPNLFIILLTAIMMDIENELTPEEHELLQKGKPSHTQLNQLFYADDTLILASNHEAAELLLHNIQIESDKYNLSLHLNKCVLLRLNSIHNVHFLNGDAVPVACTATYLGSSISAN